MTVLEKNAIIGGGLQTFKRNGVRFPTGMHIFGGFQEGGNLRKIFAYLGVLDKMTLRPMDSDASDVVTMMSTGETYSLPQGKERLITYLSEQFPAEKEHIRAYINRLFELSEEEDLFYLREAPAEHPSHSDDFLGSVNRLRDQYINDPKLKTLLGYLTPLFGSNPQTTPAYIHALLSTLHINGTFQFVDESQQMAEALAEVIENAGGQGVANEEVVKIEVENRAITKVVTKKGNVYQADSYISDVHPDVLLRIIDPQAFTTAFKTRIQSVPETMSSFKVFVKFKEQAFHYQNHSHFCLSEDVVFHTADGKPYIPQNFRGAWKGDVELWYALAHSMNIPSLKVLDGIGFDTAINRAISLLGIPKEEVPNRGFVPGYPIGLGVCSVRPVELARAYSIFAGGGKEVTPMAIRSVQDRNGNVVMNPEKDIRAAQQEKGPSAQVITPQTAFVMTELLKNTVKSGTLAGPSSNGTIFRYTDERGKQYQIPAAGKTGTTQNWADAWTAGFTPYYTSIFWFGFDKPGQSLGLHSTGSTLAGYAWADYMKKIHEGLPMKEFPKPATGVIEATVCSVSGGILTPECGNNKVTAWYLEGTQPTNVCTMHSTSNSGRTIALYRLQRELYKAGFGSELIIKDTSPLSFDVNKAQQGGEYGVFVTNLRPPEEGMEEGGTGPDYNYLME